MNRATRVSAYVVAAAVAYTSLPSRVTALDRVRPPLEPLLAHASFIGIVECEVAGGIVADYRVLESWKGSPVGSRVRIGRYVDIWEPQYPLALCGGRYLVVADTFQGAWSLPPTPSLTAVPLWYRQIQPQYYASWPPTRLPLGNPDRTGGILTFGRAGARTTLDELREEVDSLTALKGAALELALLRSAHRPRQGAPGPASADSSKSQVSATIDQVLRSTSVESVVAGLIALARTDRDASRSIWRLLFYGGGDETLRQLEAIPEERWPFSQGRSRILRLNLRVRLGLEQAKAESPRYLELARSDSARAAWRDLLQRGALSDPRRQSHEAFEGLCALEPDRVAHYLETWLPPRTSEADSGLGYEVGSYFAWRCPRDRRANLTRLLDAADPWVRVAAGVYLCFEDEAAGMHALRRLSELPGDPGAWAALTLARRGDRASVPRALEVFREPAGPSMATVVHSNLQKRVIELLSNSAHRSRIALPTDWRPESPQGEASNLVAYVAYRDWWGENGGRIDLGDPWLAVLDARKVD